MRENVDLSCQLYLILLYILNIELTRRAPGSRSGSSAHLESLESHALEARLDIQKMRFCFAKCNENFSRIYKST